MISLHEQLDQSSRFGLSGGAPPNKRCTRSVWWVHRGSLRTMLTKTHLNWRPSKCRNTFRFKRHQRRNSSANMFLTQKKFVDQRSPKAKPDDMKWFFNLIPRPLKNWHKSSAKFA